MRELGSIGHFVAGAVGAPGHRVFMLEIDPGTGKEWYLAEKEHIGMLAAAALDILQSQAVPAVAPGPELSEPGDPIFRLGRIALDAAGDAITVEFHPADPDKSEPVSFTVEASLLEAMARRTVQVVIAGRPPCPVCGLPRDPEDHTCPSSNGDLRTG